MPVALFLRFIFWLWFAAAVAAGHFLILQRIPAPVIPGIIFALSALVLLGCFATPSIRGWVDGIDLRTLVLLHLTRFIGVYLLVLFQRGELPRAFAVPAGIGDIIVATLALPVALAPLAEPQRLRAIYIWNVVGLADIVLVVVTAARLNFADPSQLYALSHLPLSLLPTFIVPLIIATHVIIFSRVARARRAL